MGHLILHIGTAKTGTTSIQGMLLKNRNTLDSHGISFPLFNHRHPGFPIQNNGMFLNDYIQDLVNNFSLDKRNYKMDIDLLTSELHNKDTVLLSAERFWRAPFHTKVLENPVQKRYEFWTMLNNQVKSFGATKITFIVYFRRQDFYACSKWKQNIIAGEETPPFSDFCEQHGIPYECDYYTGLETIRAAFKDDARFIIRHFDPKSFPDNDVCRDFCDALGLPIVPDATAIRQNDAISFDIAEAIRRFDANHPGSEWLKYLKRVAYPLSYRGKSKSISNGMDSETSKRFMEFYEEGNLLLEKKYYGKKLFSDDFRKDHYWVEDERTIRCTFIRLLFFAGMARARELFRRRPF